MISDAAYVARAPADGSVLLVASQSETTMLKANRLKPPYDIDNDLVPVAKLMDQDYLLVVPRSLNVTRWSEFVSYAKSRGSLTYASAGIGTTAHVMSEHLMAVIGVKSVHVPYQGAATLRPDLLAGIGGIFHRNIIPEPFVTGFVDNNKVEFETNARSAVISCAITVSKIISVGYRALMLDRKSVV